MGLKYCDCFPPPKYLSDIEEEDEHLYTPQSGELHQAGVDMAPAMSSTTEQITAFADQDAGWTADVGSAYDSTMELGSNSDADLGNFLQRPIRSHVFSWAVGQPLFEQFNPWSSFITNSRVAEKLANYELLRCNMNMKIVISGTGFHYSRALVSYNPLSGYDFLTVNRNFIDADLVAASQRPHFFLNPTNNTGGELDIPYFFFDNYMSLSKADYNDLGEVTIKSFTNLAHANGGDDPVTVTVYLWATDVVLTMPTSITSVASFVPQSGKMGKAMNSGDEYGQGIISKPASALAKAAGKLKDVPTIGPYARATEMVANGVGQAASLFGYSRPPVVTDLVLQKPSPTGNMANTDAADAVNRLTLDSKQELTIDSRTCGLDGEDQMSIKSIACRESYLTQFSMSPTDSVDTILWNSYVTPNLYRAIGIGEETEFHLTPQAQLGQYFTNWQGSIKFRFQVVKSNFHKGRILVRWDPRSHTSEINYNTVYSRVVDLAEEDDFEIVIGWGQAIPFLETGSLGAENFGTIRLPTDPGENFNGILEVDVLNSLVSPSLDSSITFNVFVSACDDMHWGAPEPIKLKDLHLFPPPSVQTINGIKAGVKNKLGKPVFEPQSGIVDSQAIAGTAEGDTDKPVSPNSIQAISSTLGPVDHQMEVFYGESPTSLRELMKRYTNVRTYVPEEQADDTFNINFLALKQFPFNTGYDPFGVDLLQDGITPYTFGNTSAMSWFSPCYAAWRGGIRKKLLFGGNNESFKSPTVSRIGYNTNTQWGVISASTTNSNEYWAKALSNNLNSNTQGGAAATNLTINNTIEVEAPYYNGKRFSSTRIPDAPSINSCQSLQIDYLSARINPAGPGANIVATNYFQDWTAVGEDFTLFFWSGTPIIYRYSRGQDS